MFHILMRKEHHIVLFALCLWLSAGMALAQKLTLRAPSQAEVGRRIQVAYTLNTQDFDRIQLEGEFEGFELLFGPGVSTSSSISIINGKTTQSSSTTFTYTLMPKKEGHYTLPAASVNSGGKKLTSGTARIEVLPASGGGNASHGGHGQSQSQQGGTSSMHTPSSQEHIGAKDLYFSVTASKKHVFEQEAILLTYKLYSLVTVEQLAGEIPQLDGFHTQEIEQPQQRSFTMERVGNKNYGTVVWRQYVVFPQKSGKLTIPAIDYEADVVTIDRSSDPFDAFFGGGSISRRVKKIVRAPAVEIQVDPLPEKPANFSGAVGRGFSLSGKLIPEKVDANDATVLTLTVKGTGNMKLMSAPEVAWPKDFEQYDPKTEQHTKLTTGGNSGSATYEYTAVPRHEGQYTIPPVEFCYFDTDSKCYKTLTTEAFQLDVARGAGHAAAAPRQEELKELGSDIRYIKQETVRLKQPGEDIFGTLPHVLGLLLPLCIFALAMLLLRRRMQRNGDAVRVRGRKAGKAASKRLKTASRLLKSGSTDAFYDEVLHALWGYVSDKLNMPVAELNKDNVSEKLTLHGVDEASTRQFLSVLEECEFARFAPGDPASNMSHLFDNATRVIDQLDGMLR